KFSAQCFDSDRRGILMKRRGQSSGCYTRSARKCFVFHATLICSDKNGIGAKQFNEISISAIGLEVLAVADFLPFFKNRKTFYVSSKLDEVGGTGIDEKILVQPFHFFDFVHFQANISIRK